MNNKKLYLAAPLFSDAEKAYNVYLREILSGFYDVYLPQEDGLLLVDLLEKGMDLEKAKKLIFENDISAIEECDILLILLDGRAVDEGAAFELGVAYSKRKKCIALQTDPRRLLAVGNNPMISCAISRVFLSVKELQEWVRSNEKNMEVEINAYCIDFMRFPKERSTVNG